MSRSGEVAVIGAGIVGLATAYELQQRGVDVALYDGGPPGRGQSAGQSRIFRHAHDDERLVALVRRSRELWRRWERDWGVELISGDGAVAIGSAIEDKLAVLANFPEIPIRTLDAEELRRRLPLLAEYTGPAMLDVDGGAIRTLTAVEELTSRPSKALITEPVLSMRRTSGGAIELRTGTRRDEYRHVVVCAGAGTPALARMAGLSLPVQQAAHVRVTFAVRPDVPEHVTTLQDSSGVFGETGVYASPYPGNRFYSVGLSETVEVHDDGSLADPGALAELAERAAGYVERALPGLNPEPVEYVHCRVTRLPWGEDGVGVWTDEGLSVIAGHNLFKQAPALGETLAAAALGEGLPEELRPEAELGR